MAASNTLQLVVSVDSAQANRAIKVTNIALSQLGVSATQSGRAAMRGMNQLERSVTKGAAAGTVLAHAFETAARSATNWLAGSVALAGRLEVLRVGTEALARARGIDAAAANRWIKQLQDIDYTAATSTQLLNRMLAANLDPAKAPLLGKHAESLANAFGMKSEEVLDKLFVAIETGQARALKRMGLNVDLAKATELATLQAKLQGRVLSEDEEIAVRFEEVMRRLSVTQGIGAKASEKATERYGELGREITSLREELGSRFLPAWNSTLDVLIRGARHVRENADAWSRLAEVLAAVTVAAGGTALAVKGAGAAGAFIKGFAPAAAGVAAGAAAAPLIYTASGAPFVSGAAGAAGGGVGAGLAAMGRGMLGTITGPLTLSVASTATVAILGTTIVLLARRVISSLTKDSAGRSAQDRLAEETAQARNEAAARALASGNRTGALALLGNTAALQSAEGRDRADRERREEEDLNRKIAAAKRALELREQIEGAIRASREYAQSAVEAASDGITKIALDAKSQILKLGDQVKGAKLPAEVFQNIGTAMMAKIAALEEESSRRRKENELELFQKRLDYEAQYAAEAESLARQRSDSMVDTLNMERDARLRGLEGADAQRLTQKLAVEQQRADIEIEYARKVHDVKIALFDMETAAMLAQQRLQMELLDYSADRIEARLKDLSGLREAIKETLAEQTNAAVQAAQQNAANRQIQMIRDQYRQIFESLKQQAGGVFDALLTKSESVWHAIGNSFKTAILTAIKDVVSSRVAAMLMQLFTGVKVGFAQGGVTTGPLGKLGTALSLGAATVFGAAGVAVGGSAAGGAEGGRPFVPGAGLVPLTPTFTGGPHPLAGGGSGAAAAPAGSGLAGWPGLGAGAKNWLASLGNLGQKTVPMGSFGGTATTSGSGVYGAAGGAMLLGGATLAMLGLRRGGLSGLAMTTAGGALIGGKFGGPIGAAMGAGAGLLAGFIRLFVKGATEKAREKIKAFYGVDVRDMGILRQIVDTAKQQFGGNLDVTIRGPQVRDMIELYAMSTGQNMSGLPPRMLATTLSQFGGRLFEQPTFSGGALFPSSGLERLMPAGVQSAGPTIVTVQLDHKATIEVLRGEAAEAIANNPRPVQAAAMSATKANAGRRTMLALQVSPGTITS